MPFNSCGGKRPQRASASKAKSSVLSQLSGLDNVLFNDFIDDELDSEDVSEQRASTSLKQMRWLRSILSGIMRQTQM